MGSRGGAAGSPPAFADGGGGPPELVGAGGGFGREDKGLD